MLPLISPSVTPPGHRFDVPYNSLIRNIPYKGEWTVPRLKQIGIDVEINGVIEKNRRAFSESENEILRRLLLGAAEIRPPRAPALQLGADQTPIRQRGLWTVELNGVRRSAPNLKGAYKALLLELQKLDSTFLQRFSSERSRSRRFVSRQPGQLYLASPALAKDHAQPLNDDWFFDTNLSTEQVSKRIRVAARLCGLNYGKDVRILSSLQEI